MMENNKIRLEITKILDRKPHFLIRWGLGICTSIAIVIAILLLTGIDLKLLFR